MGFPGFHSVKGAVTLEVGICIRKCLGCWEVGHKSERILSLPGYHPSRTRSLTLASVPFPIQSQLAKTQVGESCKFAHNT